MGTPPRQGRLGVKVDSKAIMSQNSTKKSSSTPLRQPRNRCDSSPSTPSCRSSLRKLHVHENVENNNVKSTKSSSTNSRNATNGKDGETTVSSPIGTSCPSLLVLEPRVGRQTRRSSGSSSSSSSQTTSATMTSTTLIPCMESLPVIEEENSRSRLLRKSPRTSITKPKLSPRKDVMSPLRPPPPSASKRNHHRATTTTMDVIEEESRRLHKSPRRSSFTKQPMLSPKKGPISPLLPPRTLRSITDASYFNDFTTTLTPIILYGDNNYKGRRRGGGEHNNLHPHPPQSAPIVSNNQQHYHQSPHWSGQVRINPFSPVPEQYLRPPPPPPSSIKSVTRESRKRSHHSCFYGGLLANTNNDNNHAYHGGAEEGGPPTLPMEMMMTSPEHPSLPQAKKARFHNSSIILPRCASQVVVVPGSSSTSTSSVLPRFDESEISPTDVMTQPPMMRNIGLESGGSGGGRKSLPPPLMDLNECTNGRTTNNNNNNIHTANTTNNNNRMPPVKRGRYLDDFQEVQFLGAGSFGSVYACLSRLDGCMYAVKSISPTGRSSTSLSSSKKGDSNDLMRGQDDGEGGGGVKTMGGNTNAQYLYGKGPNSMLSSAAPRRDLPPSPQRRKKSFSRLGGIGLEENNNSTVDDDDDRYNLDVLEGSRHWNESALRRVLREVFALAALCQQDDFRTFHVVRYQQAWLEGDGTLYIQT